MQYLRKREKKYDNTNNKEASWWYKLSGLTGFTQTCLQNAISIVHFIRVGCYVNLIYMTVWAELASKWCDYAVRNVMNLEEEAAAELEL